MAKIHYLNVNKGDCIILEHNSGRVTVFDISAGNIARQQRARAKALVRDYLSEKTGNYGMCQHPTNPLDYLTQMGVSEVWRFILSHPDMDHLDGFDALLNEFKVLNFWDSGARKNKPDFSGYGGYREEDWDRYGRLIAGGEPGTNTLLVQADSRFKYANGDDNNGAGDALYILAPNRELIDEGKKLLS